MKPLVIARMNMIRTLRDRLGLFFILVLPMIIIVVLGMTYGGMGRIGIGVANEDGGALADELVAGIRSSDVRLDVRAYATTAELRDAVQRGYVEVGLSIPDGYDAAARSGGTAPIEVIAQARSWASVARAPIDTAIAEQQAVLRAARFVAAERDLDFDEALTAARSTRPAVAGVAVNVEAVTDQQENPDGFTVGAHSQLVLFMFLTALTGAAPLVVSRQLGVSRRMFSTPTSARSIIAGEALGRFALALFQGLFIVLAAGLLFGVEWFDPLATGGIVLAFGLVAAGAAMLIGSIASNESQVGALGAGLGMLLGLIGGTMVPADVFPKVMQVVAHITPHAWAMDGFRKLLLDEAGFADIVPQLGALLGFGVLLLGLAVWRFRATLTAGGR